MKTASVLLKMRQVQTGNGRVRIAQRLCYWVMVWRCGDRWSFKL